MDIVLVVLRLIHIVAAAAWFGLGITTFFFINPAAISAGETGLRFLAKFNRLPLASNIMAMVAGTTSLAGILLYVVTNSASRFSSTGNMVLGIGALAGLLATVHGGAVMGRVAKQLDGALESSDFTAAQTHLLSQQSHARVSLVLMVIALVGMASARYL